MRKMRSGEGINQAVAAIFDRGFIGLEIRIGVGRGIIRGHVRVGQLSALRKLLILARRALLRGQASGSEFLLYLLKAQLGSLLRSAGETQRASELLQAAADTFPRLRIHAAQRTGPDQRRPNRKRLAVADPGAPRPAGR